LETKSSFRVINLVTSIEIPLPDSPDSLDENDELLDGPTI